MCDGGVGAIALELLDTARASSAIVSGLRMRDMDGAGLWREVSQALSIRALAWRMLFVTGDTLSPDARQFLEGLRKACRIDEPLEERLIARPGGGTLLE